MNTNTTFFFDVLLFAMCIYSVAYLVYGRIKRKALIGHYRPGKPYYKEFLKIVDRKLYMVIAIIATLLTIVGLVLSGLKVIEQQADHSILFVAPIMVLTLFVISFKMIYSAYSDKSR